MQQQPKKSIPIKGYLYILVQTFKISTATKEVVCHLSLGENANCNTAPHSSGKPVNEVFLIEVAQDTTRLNIDIKQDGTSLGECRYDIIPFFAHPGLAHTMTSDITKTDQEKIGDISVKVTYYSAEHGKIRLRVFHLDLPLLVQDYKQAKLKAKIGIFAQSSPLWDMTKPFDHTLQLLVLTKNSNLQFEVVHTEGILAKYTIYDLQKSGLLINQTKAYQVSLFNGSKAVGTIKYQVDWIH